MDSLTRGLLDMGHQVKVVSIHTDKHPFLPDEIEPDYLAQTQLEVAYADTELNVRDALSHLVTGESYHLSRFLVPEMERTVEDALRAQVYDVVLLGVPVHHSLHPGDSPFERRRPCAPRAQRGARLVGRSRGGHVLPTQTLAPQPVQDQASIGGNQRACLRWTAW